MSETSLTIRCHNPQQGYQAVLGAWPWLKSMLLEIDNNSGIYQIKCIANENIYIGSSKNVRQRLRRHFVMLTKGIHENGKIQNSFNKYGINQFEILELEKCNVDDLFKVEQKWIDKHIESGLLFNINKIAARRPPSFNELDAETKELKRQKHKLSSTGRKGSQNLLNMLAKRTGVNNPNYGKSWNNPERLEQARKRMQGAGSPTFGLKGKDSPIFGIKRSDETRKKMSQNSAQTGKLGALHHSSIPCARITTDGVTHHYEGIHHASRDVGFCVSTIVKWCKGKRTPRDGSVWSYS